VLDWNYFLGPAVWCFFIMGVVSYKLSMLVVDQRNKVILGLIGAPLLVLIAFVVASVDAVEMWTAYAVTALVLRYLITLPNTFAALNRIDARIGDFSYPIYLTHLLVMWPMLAWIGGRQIPFIEAETERMAAILAIVFIISMTYIFIEKRPWEAVSRSRRGHTGFYSSAPGPVKIASP
jgi:peptidoglycan/LPS O-acetylase OafA/YrhL